MVPPRLLPDIYLIHKIRHGDRDAFSGLYDRHVRRVHGMLFRLSGSAEIAEDLTQETFLAAFSSLPTYEGRGAFSSWICGIALRTYQAYYRFAKRIPETESSIDSEEFAGSREDDPLAVCTQRDADRALKTAIRRLPPAAREAFVLIRVEGLSYQEAADYLEIPLGTVQSRLHRATQILHRELAHLIYDNDKSQPRSATKEASHVIR